ncbi:hypothetical protein M407DRAFT_244040 [Tulasnella calospora MUT 4182]|uniref:Uncharacterized protein n=1 Tax=Tulasnella calospora MUT 4182 TaxID=1051891 RepID=A0A0C3KVQ6_9AGAM|nr:hypothetical protein M407DRAFT_244040 [Tulasnella calospora MUT 4182]
MGNAASKSTRKLPTKPPAWSGARSPVNPPYSETSNRVLQPHAGTMPRASETKTQEIYADGKDPHLLINLSRIGPVDVKHAAKSLETSNSIRKSVEALRESEAEALAPSRTRNRLLVTELVDLLEERKTTSREKMEALAAKYGLDTQVFQTIAKHVNSPSGGQTVISRSLTEEGEQLMLTKAVWVNPPNPNI